VKRPLKIAFIVPDNRDEFRRYADPLPHFGTAPTALLDGFSLLPEECEIHVVNCIQRPMAIPEKLAPNIFYHTTQVGKWGWMRGAYLGCVHRLRGLMKQIQPDVVHGQGSERYGALAAAFSGHPNVVTLHGNMRIIAPLNHAPPFSYLWLAARLETFTLPRTDGVVCITNYTRQAVEGLARRTWVLANAVDRSFFNIKSAPDPSAPPTGLCVGTISLRKNQNAFIRALDPLAGKLKFKMMFASEPVQGAYGEEFHRLVRGRPWCEYIGYLNREQLKARLAAVSFVALPTVEDNCPMVVLEAMAAGVPVMASRVGGVPDLIDPEKTGLFCDPARPETFREGIERMLTQHEWARQLAATARAEALRRFHPQVIAQRHLEIYREVLAQHGQAA
jgi:glycosyltransferase involved in cell wall biosynthesis